MSQADRNEKSRRTIQALDRAIGILDLIADSEQGLALFQIAKQLNLRPQTAQHLLRTLEHHEFVHQPRKGARYYLGGQIHRLAQKHLEHQDKIMAAQPLMVRVRDRLEEYVVLAELRGTHMVALLECRANGMLTVQTSLQHPQRIHVMATAKVLLANLDTSRLEKVLDGLSYEKCGPNSPVSKKQVKARLEQVRRDGYDVSIDEAAKGIVAMAVPVRDSSGNVVAALGTAFPTSRLTKQRRKEVLAVLTTCAAGIDKLWGAPDDPRSVSP